MVSMPMAAESFSMKHRNRGLVYGSMGVLKISMNEVADFHTKQHGEP